MNEPLSIEGKIIAILQQRKGNKKDGSEWISQEFVLETEDQFPQRTCFEIYGKDKIDEASIEVGDKVNIGFNLSCREYNGKWFNTIKAWRVSKRGGAPKQNTNNPASTQTSQRWKNDDPSNNLPF